MTEFSFLDEPSLNKNPGEVRNTMSNLFMSPTYINSETNTNTAD